LQINVGQIKEQTGDDYRVKNSDDYPHRKCLDNLNNDRI